MILKIYEEGKKTCSLPLAFSEGDIVEHVAYKLNGAPQIGMVVDIQLTLSELAVRYLVSFPGVNSWHQEIELNLYKLEENKTPGFLTDKKEDGI